MHSLDFQVQSITDVARFTVQRLTSTPMPSYPDTETTLTQLLERLTTTIRLLEQHADLAAFIGAEDREVIINRHDGKYRFATGVAYVNDYAMPNFHFRMATAYSLMRSLGVPIGMEEYMRDVWVKAEDQS